VGGTVVPGGVVVVVVEPPLGAVVEVEERPRPGVEVTEGPLTCSSTLSRTPKTDERLARWSSATRPQSAPS
jgi:hypothetical protein